MDAKHSPGPWTTYHEGRKGAGYWYVLRPFADSEDICIEGKGTGEADARLIAAAPDLLAALEAVVAVPFDSFGYEAFSHAHAIIAKAKGAS